MRTRYTKIISALAGSSLLLAVGISAFPRPAHALAEVVIDPFNLVENSMSATLDYVLDPLAWQVANVAIQSITKSTVNWINSGFQGSPAFVTDLNENLRGVGDAVADRFFDELSSEIELNRTPFQDKVLDAVRLGYYLHTSPESFYTKHPYTLNQVSGDDAAFLRGDFSQGGWNAWFATMMNPQNNVYGSRMLAEEALTNTVSNATNGRLQELSWNRGFLSWRGDCIKAPVYKTGQGPSGGSKDGSVPPDPVSLEKKDSGCASYTIKTPGSVIMEQLNDTLGANVNRLVSADEFNEIIGALMNQLAIQVLGGGDGGGLSGVSKPSSGGGSSFLDRATDPSQSGSPDSGLVTNFARTIQSQQKSVEDYRAAWTRIQGAAQAAQNACGTRATEAPTPEQVLARASTALVTAANAKARLDSLATRITAITDAGGNQTSAVLSLSTEYNALMNSDVLPSTSALTEALVESEDTGSERPGSLYSQMTRLANSRTCTGSND